MSKYVIIGTNITKEQIQKIAELAHCSVDDIEVMSPEEYHKDSYTIRETQHALDAMNNKLSRDWDYFDDKKDNKPWYAQFDKKRGQKHHR